METEPLLLMLTVQVLVTSVMIYSFIKVLKKRT
jgi:hypothetical protein